MTTFSVPEMSCGHCKAAIEKSLKTADPAVEITFDLEHRTVSVESGLDVPALVAAFEDAGYEAVPA